MSSKPGRVTASVISILLSLSGRTRKPLGRPRVEAKVIGTEHWHKKAEQAREYWRQAGEEVEGWI